MTSHLQSLYWVVRQFSIILVDQTDKLHRHTLMEYDYRKRATDDGMSLYKNSILLTLHTLLNIFKVKNGNS